MHDQSQQNSNYIFEEEPNNNFISSPKIDQSNHLIEQPSLTEQNQVENQTATIIRIPFYAKTTHKIAQFLTPQILQKIDQKQECVNLSINLKNKQPFNVNIFKKKLTRPMQILKVKKLIHKKTGQTIKVIKKAQSIDLLYDYEELGDFVNIMGSQNLYNSKKYGLKQQDILKQIKQHLSESIHSTDEPQNEFATNDKFVHLIQPLFYLKSYNFVPPLCDMLTNKIKPKSQENFQVNAKNINYEEEIPHSPNVQVPKFISESELYKKITSYMQKRPCWLKNSLYYALYQDDMKDKFTINDFKNVMKYTAYTFRNGPWKHTFCKFGFDPKKEFKSIIYQSIALKLKQRQVQDYENDIEEEVYDPTFQEISSRFIRSYQLCDIGNEAIRQIVQGKLITKEGECTKQHGWLNAIQHGKIMKIMKSRVQQSAKYA